MYLEIPVNNVPSMEVVKCPNHTRRAESGCVLIKSGPMEGKKRDAQSRKGCCTTKLQLQSTRHCMLTCL